VSPSHGPSYSATWTGIDGFQNNSLIQAGTEQDYYNHSPHYFAWWTTSGLGFAPQPVFTVSPNDQINVSIHQISPGTWDVSIADTTNRQSFDPMEPVSYSGPLTSAEWIEEAPTKGGQVAALANYGSATFDHGTANGSRPGLTASNDGVMVSRHGQQISTPSTPDGDADGFTVQYGATQPSPPSS
jgi:hypothetical protein